MYKLVKKAPTVRLYLCVRVYDLECDCDYVAATATEAATVGVAVRL